MKPRRLAALTAAACCAWPIVAGFAGTGGLSDNNELLQIIRSVHDRQDNTGFVFVMSHRGKTVLTDFAGVANLETNTPIEVTSRFPVMSVTKGFTGLALAVAVSEGLVELDVPISAYLPDYHGQGANKITLRMLAQHTAGVPHRTHPERKALYLEHYDDATSSMGAYDTRPLLHEPGTAYGYSSSGYNLIAAVIETAADVNYKTYVRERVLKPLGLESTDFDDVLVPVAERVRLYSHVDVWAQPWQAADQLQQVPTWDFSYNLGGGNLYSTAGDLIALGNALLQHSHLPEGVWQKALELPGDDPIGSPWSLGWIHGSDDDGRRTVYITGATPGVQAALYIYPEEQLVFAALANCWGRNSAGAELVIGAPQRLVAAYLAQQQ